MRAYTLATALLLAASGPALGAGWTAQTDTIINVGANTQLDLDTFQGEVTITTWDRSAVRILAEHTENVEVNIQSTGPALTIRSQPTVCVGCSEDDEDDHDQWIEYTITVPASMPLMIQSVHGDVTIDGMQSRCSVATVHGDVFLRGGRNSIRLTSVEGEVELTGAEGTIVVDSVNDDIQITDSGGSIQANAVNGDINLMRVTTSRAQAETINGEILYAGSIQADGTYRFSSHNGDIDVTFPQGTNASVTVSTFQGDIEADFPITITEARHGQPINFTLGDGRATIEIESFQGTVYLTKNGS